MERMFSYIFTCCQQADYEQPLNTTQTETRVRRLNASLNSKRYRLRMRFFATRSRDRSTILSGGNVDMPLHLLRHPRLLITVPIKDLHMQRHSHHLRRRLLLELHVTPHTHQVRRLRQLHRAEPAGSLTFPIFHRPLKDLVTKSMRNHGRMFSLHGST